jgi:hypothetical protein
VTGAGIAMNVQVTTTLISGAAALIVALLGIAGAIVAQLLATRRAYDNSLALFKRQHAEEEASQRQQRDEDNRREDAHRFADQCRATFARFLQLADDVHTARVSASGYLEIVETNEDGSVRDKKDTDPVRQRLVKRAHGAWREHYKRAQQGEDQLRGLVAEIDLLGSADVRASARELRLAVEEHLGHEFAPARDAFVEAAREELAVTDDDDCT